MKLWIVLDHDYDNTWIVAAYPSAELAAEHERLMGGYIDEIEILETLHPDATDPAKQAERAAEADKRRHEYESYQARLAADAKWCSEVRPRSPHMGLCHCETFTGRGPNALIPWTEHGYCRYCGGWSPSVFRENMGDAAMRAEIDKLAIHDQEKMREIVSRL